jgi:hypothetical protein
MKKSYTIIIDDDYINPIGPIDTNENYLIFVNNKATQSYMAQYNTSDLDSGITAAKEAYNFSFVLKPISS